MNVTVTNGNGSDTTLDLNHANLANIENATFVGTSITIGRQSCVMIEIIHMSRSRSTALAVYDSNVTLTCLVTFMNNTGALLAYKAIVQFMANATCSFSHCHDASDNSTVGRGGAITSFLSHLIFQSKLTTFTLNAARYMEVLFMLLRVLSL